MVKPEIKQREMIIPKLEDMSEIIDTVKTLKEKQADFIKKKLKNASAKKFSQDIATCHITKPIEYTGNIEKLIKAAAGLDGKLLKKEQLMEDVLALFGNTPTKTLEKVVPTLPIDELRRLRDEVVPELLRNNEISVDNIQRLQQIKKSLSRELEKQEKSIADFGKIIEKINEIEVHRIKRAGSWPKEIQNLGYDILECLYPYRDYLKENGSWGEKEQIAIEFLIQNGEPSNSDILLHELRKIKHKIEVESEQEVSEKAEEIKTDSLKHIAEMVAKDLGTGKAADAATETEKKGRKRGRPLKYTETELKKMESRFNTLVGEGKQESEAWSTVGDEHNTTPNGAKMAVRRYQKNHNKKQK